MAAAVLGGIDFRSCVWWNANAKLWIVEEVDKVDQRALQSYEPRAGRFLVVGKRPNVTIEPGEPRFEVLPPFELVAEIGVAPATPQHALRVFAQAPSEH